MDEGGQVMRTGFHSLSAVAIVALCLAGADWPRFRGPDGAGVSADKGLPINWEPSEHFLWKMPLPGPGSSSPIVFGDRIYLTCYSGYGEIPDAPGDVQSLALHLLALQRDNGRLVWDKSMPARQPEGVYRGFVTMHGYGSATPTTDGELVYAFFGRSGVFAFDRAGQQRWHATVGDDSHSWGSAASPVLWKNLLVVNASVESKSLVALDKTSGKEVWRVKDILDCWGTPLVVSVQGREELVLSMRGKVLGIDPETGAQRWECVGVKDYICPSAVAHGDVVFVTGGRKPPLTMAIRAGGQGDVTKTHVLWTLERSPKVGTPLVYDGHLYWVNHQGMAVCVDAKSGKLVYEQRLDVSGRGDKAYASLVAADRKFFAVTRQDGVFVLAAGPEFTELARNRLGDNSIANASPAIVDGRILLRTDRNLFCIGKPVGGR